MENHRVSPMTYRLLTELSAQSNIDEVEILERAVLSIYRSWIGRTTEDKVCAEEEPDDPRVQSGVGHKKGAFMKMYSQRDADVVIRQVSPENFCLEEGFRYTGTSPQARVPAGRVTTDLASVPEFLTWLVPRYGRHTLSALLHDFQVKERNYSEPNMREVADETFRETMAKCKVPFVRRWAMWGAVNLQTQLKRKGWNVVVGVWLIAFALAGVGVTWKLMDTVLTSLKADWPAHLILLSVTAFIWGLFKNFRFGIAASYACVVIALFVARAFEEYTVLLVAAPLILSFLWGKRYRLGLISSTACLVLPLPTVAILFTLGLYVGLEGLARMLSKPLGLKTFPVRNSKL